MKVADLLPMQIDIDVYDDVCEDLCIAFCGPMRLTEKGKKQFADVLDFDVVINPYSYGGYLAAIVKLADDENWRKKLNKAVKFFKSLAGYCSVEDYERWFIDD